MGVIKTLTGGKMTIDPAVSTPFAAGAIVRHNDGAAFLSAVAAIKAAGPGGKLHVPRGTYNLDSISIAIDFNNLAIEGDARNSTIVNYSGLGCAFTGNNGPKALQYFLSFRSFTLFVTNPAGSGICLYRPMYAMIAETYIENNAANQTGHALLLDGSDNFGTGVIVENNRFNQWKRAVLITGNPASGYIVRSRLVDNEMDGKFQIERGSVAVEMNLAQNCEISGGNIEQWETGIKLTGSTLRTVLSFVRFEAVGTVWDIGPQAAGTMALGNMLFPDDAKLVDMSGSTTVVDSSTHKPVCDAAHRGEIYVDRGVAHVADQPAVCAKKSDDSYAWIQLAVVP